MSNTVIARMIFKDAIHQLELNDFKIGVLERNLESYKKIGFPQQMILTTPGQIIEVDFENFVLVERVKDAVSIG